MRFRLLFLLIFFFNISSDLRAQAPGIAWQRIYSSNEGDYGHKVTATSDGGSLVVGHAEFYGRDIRGFKGINFIDDIWVLKHRADGSLDWQLCLGGKVTEYGYDVKEISDGYLVFGSSGSRDCSLPAIKGGMDFYLVKLSKSGEIIWDKRYGGSLNEYGYAMTVGIDGSIYMAGVAESANGDLTKNEGEFDSWVIKTDAFGNLVWQKSIGGNFHDEFRSVLPTADGGAMVAGFTYSETGSLHTSKGKHDAVIMKISAAGVIEWTKIMGGNEPDLFNTIAKTNTNSFLIGGFSSSKNGDLTGLNPNGFAADAWLVNIDGAGTVLWQKAFGRGFNDFIQELKSRPDGSFIGAGSGSLTLPSSCSYGKQTGIWIFKLSPTGNVLWEKTIPSAYADGRNSVDILADNSFIVSATATTKDIPGFYGNSSGSNSTVGDVWLIKMYPENFAVPAPVFEIEKNTALVCEGKTATIKTRTVNTGTRPVYKWTRNGVEVPNPFSVSLTASDFKDGENVTCTITNGNECDGRVFSVTDQVTIHYKAKSITPNISISANSEFICECNEIKFTAVVTGAGSKPSYQWRKNGKPIGVDLPYFISKDLEPGDLISCDYYDLEDCINGSEFVSSNQVFMQLAPYIQTPYVVVKALPESPCKNTTVRFVSTITNAGVSPAIEWILNGNSTGIKADTLTIPDLKESDEISCVLTTDNNSPCIKSGIYQSNKIKVKFSDYLIPSVSLQTDFDSVCKGTPVQFKAMAVNAGQKIIYQWKVNGVNTGTNSHTILISDYQENDAVTCFIYADSTNTCMSVGTAISEVKKIFIKKNAELQLSITELSNNVCQGKPVIFKADYFNAGENPKIHWFVNGIKQVEVDKQLAYTLPKNGDKIQFLLSPGSGTCRITDTLSPPAYAVVKDSILLQISPADTTIPVGTAVQLQVIASGTVQSFLWSPQGKLINSGILNARTIPLEDDLELHLSATNSRGCHSVASGKISVNSPFYMPNAFTPNRDGHNDEFRIPLRSRKGIVQFTIFNRWGNIVFRTNNVNLGWNGTLKGQEAPSGVYSYILTGTNEKGEFQQKGNFVLIR